MGFDTQSGTRARRKRFERDSGVASGEEDDSRGRQTRVSVTASRPERLPARGITPPAADAGSRVAVVARRCPAGGRLRGSIVAFSVKSNVIEHAPL